MEMFLIVFFFSELALIMGAKLHGLRVAVWGEAPETPEERKVCPMLYSWSGGSTDIMGQLLRKIDFFILVSPHIFQRP